MIKKLPLKRIKVAAQMDSGQDLWTILYEYSLDYYKKLEVHVKDCTAEAKEPFVDASKLLKELVDEISSAKQNLENGLVRKFEESNTR